MRTLKKTLCLVLALAMMVGLCAVGASAVTVDDYKDKDQIPNMEAFATLTAIGVFQGDDKGNVNPTASLTRAEGATVITKMHATSGAGTSSFTDMATAAWAQPAVAYCETNGIINGYGDGTFGPSDPLSTVAFAKMCVCALGYDAVAEGMTGPQWEINTIKLVNKLDLAYGIANPDWSGACPRWVAAQLAFNTLRCTMVEYEGGMTVSTSDGTVVEVGAKSKEMENGSYSYMTYWDDGYMQFCENFFPNLKVDWANDKFGMPTNYWYMGNNRKDNVRTTAKTIVSALAGDVFATYDTNMIVTGKTLFTDSKANKTIPLTVIVNGVETETVYANRLDTNPVLAKYAGSTVYLIDTSLEGDNSANGYGVADTLIVKKPFLAKVTKVTEATATKDRFATLKIYNSATGTNYDYTTKNFAKNDWLLVYPAADTITATTPILEATLADSVKGTLSKVAKSPFTGKTASLTIDGVAYNAAAAGLANLGPQAGQTVDCEVGLYALGTGLTAYLSNGYVLGVVPDAVAYGDYVFTLGKQENGSALGSSSWTIGYVDQSAKTIESVAYGVKTSADADAKLNSWATVAEVGSTVAITPATALNYGFSMAGLSSAKATLGTSGSTAIIADSKTVFVVRTATGFKSYTGLANVPNYDDTMDAYALVPDYTGAHAAAVYFDATGKTAKNTATAAIYMISSAYESVEKTSTTLYNWTAIVDGKVTTLQSKTTDLDGTAASGLFTPYYDGTYLAKLETALYYDTAYVTAGDAYAISVDGGDLTVNGTPYVLADGAVAYLYDAKDFMNPLKTGTPEEMLDGVSGGKATLCKVSATNDRIKTIYFIVG